jgi:hypothetical protein
MSDDYSITSQQIRLISKVCIHELTKWNNHNLYILLLFDLKEWFQCESNNLISIYSYQLENGQ